MQGFSPRKIQVCASIEGSSALVDAVLTVYIPQMGNDEIMDL